MLESGKISDLSNRDDRTIARLAKQATIDTIQGGARAMVLAKRLERMGSGLDVLGVVGDVYSASCGHVLPEYRVCACPECGQTHLGEVTALMCCAWMDEEDGEREFVDEEDDDEGDYEIDRLLGFDPDICGD